jgi:hypothetical protein
MMPNPIVFRSVERRSGPPVLIVEETIGPDTMVRSIELDELTFEGVQHAFQTHPFRRKRPENDIVLFTSLITPLDTDKKYLGLQIVNGGSRHHLRIEASPEVFAAVERVFRSWCARFEEARASSS